MGAWSWYNRICALSVLALLLVFTGCTESGDAPAPFSAPPKPRPGATPLDPYYVITRDYSAEYTSSTRPFDRGAQFASALYPIPMAYASTVPAPDGFVLATQSERAIVTWATADPRICVISGVTDEAHITVSLADSIAYNGLSNIIGLTKLLNGGPNPRYEVYIAVQDPLTGQPMTSLELGKTLTHELGHVFGLGHSEDPRDLMYYRASAEQGATWQNFLTYGDAMAMWSTLNKRRVDWVASRPTITYPAAGAFVRRLAPGPTRVREDDDEIICVYTRP